MNVFALPQKKLRLPSVGSFLATRILPGLRRRLLIATVGSFVGLASSLNAAWTYTGGTLNAAAIYDGAGEDSALNPRVQGLNSHNDYIGLGGTGSITVASGSLTIIANDFNFGRNNNNSNGTLTVASSASFRIEQINQWGGGIGIAGNNTNTVVGTINIAGSMTWFLSGSSSQSMVIGSGGANTSGTVNLNGGTLVFELDSAQAITSTSAGFRVGSGTAGRGTINLNSGTMTIRGNLPFALGGQWTNTTTTPVFSDTGTNAGVGVITVNNGSLECLGSSLFSIGTDDYINFVVGGSGKVSILSWDNVSDPGYAKFKALIDAGKIRLNGAAVTPGDYSGFVFSSVGTQGIISAVNTTVAPTFIAQPNAGSAFVGESFSFLAQVAGNPAPTLQWQKSTDSGVSWAPVSGATSSTLSIATLVYADNGLYRLVASNSQGTANSNEVALTVTYPNPVITTAPVSRTVLAGNNVTLAVAANGLGSLTYLWQKNGVDIPGQTGVSLTLASVTTDSAGVYSVIVSDHAAEADSLPATTATVVASVGVLDVPSPSRAISLNFVGAATSPNSFGGATDLGVLAPSDSAGVLPVSNWNNSSTVNGTASQTVPFTLVDNTGASTSVSATWSSANTWAVPASQGAASTKTAAGRLLHGYIERRATVAPGNTSVSFTQIPYGTYDVYVYMTSGTAGEVGKVTVNGNDASAIYYKAPGGALGLDPAYVQSTAADLASAQALPYNANFVRFSGLTGPSLSVAVADAVSGKSIGGMAGVSIVDTTPAGSAYPPLLTATPANLLKRGGSSAAFTVAATSLNPGGVISYQWSKNGVLLPGATSATLNLTALAGADSGTYSVLVTDTSTATGSPTTAMSQASLVVVDSSRPALLNVDIGNVTTSALGSGLMLGDGILRTAGIPSSDAKSGIGIGTGGPGTDIWMGLAGTAGSTTYTDLKESTGLGLAGVTFGITGVGGVTDNTTAGSLGSVTNGSGPLLRDLVFTDNQTVPITCTVSGLGDFVGKKITLVVYAVGTRSTLFGENTVDDAATVTLSGSNNYLASAPIMTRNVEGRDLAFNTEAYAAFEGIVSPSGTVVWTLGPDADAGSIPLNGFQLLLTDTDLGLAPAINTQPVSATRLEGLPHSFTAGVTASPAPVLQWQKSADGVTGWTNISGANASSLAFASVSASDSAFYRLVATNSVGTATSAAVSLNVQSFPLSASRGISVNWQRDGGTLTAGQVAGVVGLANWDNRTASTATFSNLIDSTGAATTASVQLSTGTNWRAFTTTATLPMQQLYKGYWDFAPGSSAVGTTGTLTVNGLTYASYDVYVYFVTDSPDNTITAQISVNGGAPVYGKAMGSASSANLPLYMAQATATTAESSTLSNYVKVNGLTGSSFNVTLTKVNGNYGIVGFQVVSAGLTPIESWRQTYFSTTSNSGSAADTADPDGDGLVNFLEYAFGENPTVLNGGASVVVGRSDNGLTLSFVHIDDPSLSYIVEATNDLNAAWTSKQTYTGFTAAGITTYTDDQSLASATRRFLRVRVTKP